MFKQLHAILFLLISSPIFSQTTFVHRAGGSYSDYATSCFPTSDGGIILSQESCTNGMDLHSSLIKTDANGVMQWYKNYRIGGYTLPFSVLENKEGGYVVLAMASDSSYINNNNYFLALYKTDINGNTQWNKQYAVSNNDMPLNMVYRKAGGYISFSVFDYNIGTPQTSVITFDGNGNIIWAREYSFPYGLKATRGIEMPNQNICFIGTIGDPVNSFFLDVAVVMLDPSGNIIWSKSFGTMYDDEPYALAADSNNNIFITGRNVFIVRNWDGFVIKLDKNGNKTGSMDYDGGTSNGEIMRCIIANDDGSFKLLGDMGTFDERDITMLNIDSDLTVASARRYTFSTLFTNYPYDFYRAADGGLVFTGDYRPPTADRDAIIVKTEADGTLPCYMTNPVITEYNENFTDTIITVTQQSIQPLILNYPAMIPANPFSDHIVCSLSTEVNEVTGDELIYPNPVTDKLQINLINKNIVDVRVFDAFGRLILEQYPKNNSTQINFENLAAGIYYVRISFDNETLVKRIVKQKNK